MLVLKVVTSRLDKIGIPQPFPTVIQHFSCTKEFLKCMNCRWFSALIFLQVELLCTRPPPKEKLTVWPNCSLYTETRKAKWIQFGWQSLSEQLHLNEYESQVNTFWLAIMNWNVVFKWKRPYAAQFGRQTPAKNFCTWCIHVERGRPCEYNLPGIVIFNYLI